MTTPRSESLSAEGRLSSVGPVLIDSDGVAHTARRLTPRVWTRMTVCGRWLTSREDLGCYGVAVTCVGCLADEHHITDDDIEAFLRRWYGDPTLVITYSPRAGVFKVSRQCAGCLARRYIVISESTLEDAVDPENVAIGEVDALYRDAYTCKCRLSEWPAANRYAMWGKQ